VLGVTVDPFRSEKNLQIPQQMSDDEDHQNDTREGHDHLFADGGIIEGRERVQELVASNATHSGYEDALERQDALM